MIEIIDQFSVTLISKNMLFRGALACGEALHSPQFIFGPALVAAYRLESGTSFHPRIMFDATVFAAAKSDKRFNRYMVADPYDVPYLNPFARWETGKPLTKKALAELVQLQSVIAAGLMAGAEAPSVGEKYK